MGPVLTPWCLNIDGMNQAGIRCAARPVMVTQYTVMVTQLW